MKIAFVTNNYKPYSGGVVSAIDAQAQSLVGFGHQVSIITLDFEGLGNCNDQQPVPIIRLMCPIRFKYKSSYIAIPWCPDQAILNILQLLKPDIIHVHHPFLLGQSALKAGQKLAIPVVFTHHSQYDKFAHLIPFPHEICTNIIRQKISSFCRSVAGVIAPSSDIAHDLAKQAINNRIQVIPSPIAPLYLQTDFSYKQASQPFKLLVVSRFAKEKNLYALLDMFSQLIKMAVSFKFTLTLIGYGPELASLQNYAYHFLGLASQQVIFIEKPPKTVIKQAYEQADLFVFTSTSETQGLVLAEAMASGTPVVALAGPGQNDLVVNGQNGYLVTNLGQMTRVINKIAGNQKLHKELQLGAFQAAQAYRSEILVRQLLTFYAQIIPPFDEKA